MTSLVQLCALAAHSSAKAAQHQAGQEEAAGGRAGSKWGKVYEGWNRASALREFSHSQSAINPAINQLLAGPRRFSHLSIVYRVAKDRDRNQM